MKFYPLPSGGGKYKKKENCFMKCYNHHDRDAFAVCKACGKALCLECAEEYKNEFICKDSPKCHHVADVEYVNYFKDNSEGAWRFNRIAFMLIGAFLLVYVIVKSFMFFMIPNPLLETVLLILLAILLVKKGMDLKLR